MPRAFWIDTDTASDDAVALIMALRAPDVRVLGISTVAGNVPVEQSTRNALYVVELCGSEAPVYAGAAQPLWRVYEDATWFHGKDGLGEHNYPAARRPASPAHAVDALIDTVRANPGIVLVTLGPLTNIAIALARDPRIAENVSRCVVMGGNPCCEGNVTPAAEYNIWVDPEAARIVLRSALPVEMVGWHLCRGPAVLTQDEIDRVLAFDTPLARFAIECNSSGMEAYRVQTGEIGLSLPDPVAMSVALDPSIGAQVSPHDVEVEVSSDLTRGMTVVDRLNVAHDARNRAIWSCARKVSVVWTIDVARWKTALYGALRA
jgi:purine nucleosidase